MKKTIFLSLLLALLMIQCKSLPVRKIEKMMKKSMPYKVWEPDFFYKSRKLMLKTFSDRIMDNDSIIILEYSGSWTGGYSCTIYESQNTTIREYSAAKSKKKGVTVVDSLVSDGGMGDPILSMVLDGKLEEIKQEGENPMLTPTTDLIITILRKDNKKKKFNIETIGTLKFIVRNKKKGYVEIPIEEIQGTFLLEE
ncbi:hypothetical protein [Bacteroides sp. UBA939]|uniref:hypothetical protein n=1 Tax=Bacteroides sp. UBA939 TaxID=1946092 RepID=UPI0025BF026C|nr:hypothetical protein [Bacteroides sp. UBA939]